MVSLTDSQLREVRKVGTFYKSVTWQEHARVFSFAGYAGTGKSTVMPFILEECGLDASDVWFMAPTGKAAKVMTTKLRQMGISAQASTIHSSIYRPKALRADVLEGVAGGLRVELHEARGEAHKGELLRKLRQVEKDLDRAYDSDDMHFQLNVDAELKNKKLIIVDEASMVGERMAEDIRSFGVPVLAIGDPGQLPPVNDHPGLIIGQPDALLTEIHRQAADNPIIWFATELRNMRMPDFGRHGDALRIVRPREDDVTYNIEKATAIVCGKRDTRWTITVKLRQMMGFGPVGPVEGEPLIIIKNSKARPGIVNGTMAWCTQDVGELQAGDTEFQLRLVDDEDRPHSMSVLQQPFEAHYLREHTKGTAPKTKIWQAKKRCEQADWAYVLTCHKMQGSQAEEVVVHDEMGCFREDAWKWAYTAATRASDTLTWVTR